MPISRTNDVEIYYEKAGSGPPLVLLHAIPWDHNLWLYQVAHFSTRFTTFAIDMRCWGRSEKVGRRFTSRDICNDVVGVLADEKVDTRAIVMGCSFGSKVALALVLDDPDRFDAAILVGGNSGPQSELAFHVDAYRAQAAAGDIAAYHRQNLLRGVMPQWAESPIGRYLIDGFVERGKGLEIRSIAEFFDALLYLDLTPKLASCRVPILIVNGEHDNAFPGGARTASQIVNCERHVLAGLGHCCFLEDPAAFDEVVQDFLVSRNLWPPGPRA